MIKCLILLFPLILAEYFTCDSLGHACKVGTTCCARGSSDFGCCPMDSAVCCADSEGHCCPLGYPVCDIVHKQCKNHLQEPHSLLSKTQGLNITDTADFIYGLAAGLGIRVDQYVSCTQQATIVISLLIQVQKYLEGTTSLDHLIVLQDLGEALQHLSVAAYNCNGAFTTSVNFLEVFIESISSDSQRLWTVAGNILSSGNYMFRELTQIKQAGWEGKGYHLGRIISLLFT